MTRLLSISLVSVGVLAAAAATVPQQTLEDYYFSRPNMTNLTGTVIGDPPAYNVLRREDLAWIYEAAQERQALASRSWRGPGSHIASEPRFGHWPLSSSNQFSHYVTAHEWRNGHFETNIVVGYVSVTNNGTGRYWPRYYQENISLVTADTAGSGQKRYIAPNTNDFLQGAQTLSGTIFPSHTNVVISIVTNYPSSVGWPHEDNTTQHVDIVTMPMTNGTVSVHTNKWSENLRQVTTNTVTNVTAGASYDLLFVGRQPQWYDKPCPPVMKWLPRYSYIRECYDYLKDMRYLVDETHSTTAVPHEIWRWDYDGDVLGGYPTTNNIAYYGEIVAYSTFGMHPSSGSHVVALPSQFSWDVVHTGGVNRIKSATAYALIQVYADLGDEDEEGYYMVNLGEATESATPGYGGVVVFEKAVDVRGILNAAASALGITAPSIPADGYLSGNFTAVISSFFLLYEMQPHASLPDW